ncbi:hypothetical protein Ahy_B08g089637 isoform A [Arachis hypogaea]|uniref:MULE transposase domain-containing protein n=1 Tax=Arachis hypogaea TaxID=3818 RepID=A0A444XYH0_ARAHY|nr:hypothetical protein Ahy_B08g089637 isoform A [Arachis hypogaea]
MKIQDISNSEDKLLSRNKLSSQDLCTIVHILKDVVILNHSHSCYPDRAEMLKQHRELSMFVRRTNENNKEAEIRPSKTYQSFVASVSGQRELSFIKKDVRNYITRKKNKKNFELNLEVDHSIKNAFLAYARSKAAYEYFGDVFSFDTTYSTNRYNLVFDSFVSVNHHGQLTLLECALTKNKDIQSFK